MSASNAASTNRNPWNSSGWEKLAGSLIMARTGVQTQSPTSTLQPFDNANGSKARRRVLTNDVKC